MSKSLSHDQMDSIRDTFHAFDKNGDGVISTGELADAMRALGQNPTEAEVQRLIKQIDTDASGVLEFNEFTVMMKQQILNNNPEDDLRHAFEVFDKDKNGFICEKELKEILMKMGDSLSAQDVNEILSEADRDRDGKINYEEFIQVMMGK